MKNFRTIFTRALLGYMGYDPDMTMIIDYFKIVFFALIMNAAHFINAMFVMNFCIETVRIIYRMGNSAVFKIFIKPIGQFFSNYQILHYISGNKRRQNQFGLIDD